jgi:hypothetical protein
VTLTLHSTLVTPVRPHPPRPRAPLFGGPRPAPGATAIRNPTGCPAGSWFGPARWAPRQLSGRGQLDRGPERVAPPAPAQRRSGTPTVAQPGRGHPSRTGARAGPLAADCSSPALGGAAPGSGAGRSGTPPVARSSRWVEPHVSPQSPVAPAADCSSPAPSGPLLSLARGDPEPPGCPVESVGRAARQPSVTN